jgi:signal transduction histidine kinase/ligand-binding sensor domain-containing protein
MQMKLPRIHIQMVLSLLFVQFLHGQPKQYVFTRLSAKDGLGSNFVYAIHQDKKGFMWFATANGLQRYDGRKIIQFRPPPGATEYLPQAAIHQIFDAPGGNFWIRSGKEVGLFDPATFRYKRARIKMDKEAHPRAEYSLWQDKKGNTFCVITRYGMMAYDSATNEFAITNQPTIELPDNWTLTRISEDPVTGNYWIGADSGLALYDIKSKIVYSRYNNPEHIRILDDHLIRDPVTVLHADKKSRLWITTWNERKKGEQMYSYDLRKDRFLPDTAGLNRYSDFYKELNHFTEQSNGGLWAFGKSQLLQYDSVQKRFHYIRDEYIDDYGIKYDQVHCIYEDKEHDLWIGTDMGIYAFNPGAQSFNTVYGYKKGKRSEISVMNFIETYNKQIWVSTWGDGLLAYDSSFSPIASAINTNANKDKNYSLQWDLYEQKDRQKVWIGCQSGRLIVYDHKSKTSQFLNLPLFEEKTIRQIAEDSKGNIYLSTQYGHIVKWNRAEGDYKNIGKGFELIQKLNTIIYKLYIDPDDQLWAGTLEYGLYKIDSKNGNILNRYTSKTGADKAIFSDNVTDIYPYHDSLLLLATGALSILNTKTGAVKQIGVTEGLPSNTITGIQMDNQGSLWLSLLSGLCRYNIRKDIFSSYSQKDGIFHENFQVNASAKLGSGRLLFGNTHDFIAFNPSDIVGSNPPPDVTITDFKLFNTYLPADSIMRRGQVFLRHFENSITLEFATLSYLQKEKIIYYFKLEGIDPEWLRTERLLFANYTQLPPGRYTFLVWCENSDGVRSRNITSVNIIVQPPFYRSWWFVLLVALAVAALVYLVHRLRVKRLLEMEKVRKRIARDLHDDMGSTLSTINILSEMAKMKVNTDTAKTGEYINKISDNSSRMMEAMDDIVWSINPMNDSMQKIAARMREFATGVLEAKNIDFIFRVDDQVNELKLDMEARRDFFLLFKEAVNNLAKYSRCRHATIDISVMKSILIMKVQDDGIGFNVQEADSGNGLSNMRKRAQSLRGKLVIESEENKGTSVILEAPVA